MYKSSNEYEAAGTDYIRFLHSLLAYCISAFKYGEDKTSISKNLKIVDLTHLKLWIASARHKWVKILIE